MPKRQLRGRVKSDKTDKTITVAVERKKKHKMYHKVVNFTKSFHAHDENNDAHIGDTVLIEECKPYSKTKTWILKEVIARAV